MKIARVFPNKNSHTPDDQDSFYGLPELFIPEYNEVHISVTFTWDIEKGMELKKQWEPFCNNVKIGGPAFNDFGNEFQPGQYLKNGITITSRGCNNNCKFCFIKGKLKEIKIKPGHIIQDNNFLQCSKSHRSKVYEMLKSQKAVEFKGGLQSDLLTDWDIDQMRGLKIRRLYFACDNKNHISRLRKAINKCNKYFPDWKLHCYVLIGDDMAENKNRLQQVLDMGCYPFAQLEQPKIKINYSKEWKALLRKWSRPAFYSHLRR